MKFTQKDVNTLTKIITSRRDVRGNNFIKKKISKKKLNKILEAGITAPSVGYSQPWRFVIVDDKKRNEVYNHFTDVFNKSKEKFKDRPI